QRELDQVGRAIEVAAGDRVDNSVGEQAVFGVPAAGGPVQPGHPVRVPGEEPGAERVSEQVVVAVPLPLVVEGDDEQVLALEDLEPLAAVVAAGERVAQRTSQLREHGGVEEEPANVLGLAAEPLLDQGVQDEAVAAGERVDEAGHARSVPGAGVAAGRQGGQLQPGGPSLGAVLERGDVRRIEVEAHDVVEERVRLAGGEAQVRGAQLEELAAAAQPGQGQRRGRARGGGGGGPGREGGGGGGTGRV